MNILVISALDVWSMGKEKGAQSLYLTLMGYADRGHKVHFLTSGAGNGTSNDIHKNIIVHRFSVSMPDGLKSKKKVGFFFRIIWWWLFRSTAYRLGKRINRDNTIDVFYGYEIYGVPAACKLAERFKKPVVSRFQGTILDPWIGKPLWKLKFWNHVKAMKKRVDLIIMTDDGTRGDKVLERLGVDMSTVKFWMNGVNKTIESNDTVLDELRREYGIGRDTKVLLTINRLQYWKRIDRVINVMEEVFKDHRNCKMLIIGDGEERLKLERMVEEMSLSGHVLFLGAIPHSRLNVYYNLADLFIQTNDLSNVSNPLLEAMMAGKCIITINNGDTDRYISNNKTGVLVEEKEIESLHTKILELLNNDEMRSGLGEEARKYANDNFRAWDERIGEEVETVEGLVIPLNSVSSYK